MDRFQRLPSLMREPIIALALLAVVSAQRASAQTTIENVPLIPGHQTGSLVRGDTVFMRAPPGILYRYVYFRDKVVIRRERDGNCEFERAYMIVGDSAISAQPRIAYPLKILITVRERALAYAKADTVLRHLREHGARIPER